MEPAETPDLPVPDPLPEAIYAGVFGLQMDSPFELDEEAIRSIMYEQAQELSIHLSNLQWLRFCWDEGRLPRSGKRPGQVGRVESLRQEIGELIFQTHQSYDNCLAAYEEGFGETATRELDRYVRERTADEPPRQQRLF